MRCATCRIIWDIDDPEPPVCPSERPKLPPPNSPLYAAAVDRAQRFVSGLPDDMR